MVNNIEQLISLCRIELDIRDYSNDYKSRISQAWECLVEWMDQQEISSFSESIGNDFLDSKIGTHLSNENLKNPKGSIYVQQGWSFHIKRKGG